MYSPVWWNWQTRWTQNPVVVIPYRFDPDHRHQLKTPEPTRFPGFYVFQNGGNLAIRSNVKQKQAIILKNIAIFNAMVYNKNNKGYFKWSVIFDGTFRR